MLKFLKRQLLKVITYIFILILVNSLWFFSKWDIFILISINSFITSLFTIIISKTWLEDYKLEMNKELEKYKTKLSNYTLVTKLQYDLEFKIYTEIYGLIESHFRIMSDIIFRMENNDLKDKSKLMEKRNESYEKILSSMYKNKPFYQKEICDKISVINGLNSKIFNMYANFENADLMTVDIVKTVKSIVDSLEELSDLIRQRIENMKIIED